MRSLVCVTLFHVGAWCSDPGTHVLTFGSCRGSDTRAPRSVSLCECAVSSSLALLSTVCCCVARSSCFYQLRAFMLCLVLCGMQLVYSLAACFHGVMSCVNTWLMSFLISCVFVSVLHMAGDLFAGHVLVFLFCVSTWLCPSFLCAMCFHVNLS